MSGVGIQRCPHCRDSRLWHVDCRKAGSFLSYQPQFKEFGHEQKQENFDDAGDCHIIGRGGRSRHGANIRRHQLGLEGFDPLTFVLIRVLIGATVLGDGEIAAKTNTPLGTVKTRLELGLKKIYDGLKELRGEL